ncbi:MAG: hypothetical protein K2M45_08285 [Muribaculaceae bacterium]|nr:hypothetical protein [Muribaculaceae bacterium]
MDLNFRSEEVDGVVTVWHNESGMGLRFRKGDPLSRYTAEIVLPDINALERVEGMEDVSRICDALRSLAEEVYPYEFRG